MSNMLAAMSAAVSGLGALERTASAAQNNVTNASTPGYARQEVRLKAAAFDPQNGLAGGVLSGSLSSTRDEFIEASVRKQASAVADAQETATQTAYIDSAFS